MTEAERCDREALAVLMARYTMAGDRGLVADLAALFASDGVLRFSGLASTGPDAIAARLGLPGSRNPSLTLSRHNLTTSLIELDTDQARGRTYFQVLTDIGLDHHGVYVDRFVRHDELWLFQYRDVRIDWQSAHSLYPQLHVRGRTPA